MGGGIANSPSGIGPHGHHAEAGGDGRPSPTGRTTGIVVEIPRIRRRRPWQIERYTAVSRFMGRLLTDHDGAGFLQQTHHGPIHPGPMVSERRRVPAFRNSAPPLNTL